MVAVRGYGVPVWRRIRRSSLAPGAARDHPRDRVGGGGGAADALERARDHPPGLRAGRAGQGPGRGRKVAPSASSKPFATSQVLAGALVIRDGERKRVAGREVVRGDFVVLAEGDRVPADAVLRWKAKTCRQMNRRLTGESVPVRKVAAELGAPTKTDRPGGDDLPCVFSGSLVVRGSGIGEVTAIGLFERDRQDRSVAQHLGDGAAKAAGADPKAGEAVCHGRGAGVSSRLSSTAALRGGWLDAVLAGIALGMSMLPEEFPVVLAVFMAMGAWRISRARVLTRRAAAIETLGSATVLCTDKTGTLTENRMSIAELRLKDGTVFQPREAKDASLPDEFHGLVEFGILASARRIPSIRWTRPSMNSGERVSLGPDICTLRNGNSHTLTVFVPISSRCRRSGSPRVAGRVRRRDQRRTGSHRRTVPPLRRGSRCAEYVDQRHGRRRTARARRGPRLLARSDCADSQHDFTFEFVGLVGLADPLRASVPAAVAECRSAGIRVVHDHRRLSRRPPAPSPGRPVSTPTMS